MLVAFLSMSLHSYPDGEFRACWKRSHYKCDVRPITADRQSVISTQYFWHAICYDAVFSIALSFSLSFSSYLSPVHLVWSSTPQLREESETVSIQCLCSLVANRVFVCSSRPLSVKQTVYSQWNGVKGKKSCMTTDSPSQCSQMRAIYFVQRWANNKLCTEETVSVSVCERKKYI